MGRGISQAPTYVGLGRRLAGVALGCADAMGRYSAARQPAGDGAGKCLSGLGEQLGSREARTSRSPVQLRGSTRRLAGARSSGKGCEVPMNQAVYAAPLRSDQL